MREAPLTDRQKTDEALYGSYAPRVRGREVTAQSKDGSRTTRGGGAAMNSKNAFGSAMLVLVAALFGVVGLTVPPASAARPKPTSQGCTTAQLQTPAASECIKKAAADIRAGRSQVHIVACAISGMYCCVTKEGGGVSGCEKIGALTRPGGVGGAQGGVIGPVAPSQSPVKPTIIPSQKQR